MKEVSVDKLHTLLPDDVRRWIRGAAWIALAGYVISVVVGTIIVPGAFFSRVGEIGVIILAGFALIMVETERVWMAGFLVLGGVWFEIHFSLIWDGLIGAPGLAAFPAMVTLAALFLGRRAGFAFTLSTIVSLPVITRLHHIQTEVEGWGTSAEIGFWIMIPVICFATATLMSLGLGSLGRAVAAAQKSQAKFAGLLDHLPDAVLAVTSDRRIRTANPAAVELLGIDSIDLGATHTIGLVGGGSLDAILDDAEESPITVALAVDGEARRVEVRTRRFEDGRDSQDERLVILRDVRDVAELQDRLTQLGGLIENARQEVYVFVERTGMLRLTSRGARRATGRAEGEPGPRGMEEVNPALSVEGVRSIFREIGDGEVPPFRSIHQRADGSVYPVEVRLQRSELDGEEVIVAFASDITYQLDAEAEQDTLRSQLEHAQRLEAIGHLAGGVAHDFNNLLTVMGGCAEALRYEVAEDAMDLVDTLAEAQERGARLTQRLLSFARKDVVQADTLDLSEVVRDMETLAGRMLLAPARLEIELGGVLPFVADRGQVEQVILNLVSNARDADDSGAGVVWVRTSEHGGEVILTVTDEGVGMDDATIARAFDPFYTTKPRGKGTGLGLATVRAIVEQAGGRIEVDSEVGVGTTFRVIWPRTVELTEAAPVDLGPEVSARILFAEDDEQGRALVTRLLQRGGHEVDAVPDGETALERLEEGRAYDLVVSDVVMPGISGIELSDRIATSRPTLPVLLVSGYLDEHLPRATGLGEGRELLLKPFRTDELLHRVRRLVGDRDAGAR